MVVPADGALPKIADPSSVRHKPEWAAVTHCCLFRTLVGYPVRTGQSGSRRLTPDLAAELPVISDDGRTWTFRLRPGVRYAPPVNSTVTSRDVIRGIERAARTSPEQNPLAMIDGLEDFAAGRTTTIAGLEAPDDLTVVMRLKQVIADFPNLLADPVTAPVPAAAAEGRDAVPATGPYAVGKADDAAMTLVRNPRWSEESDPLRRAYADRIEFRVVPTPEDASRQVDAGEADLVWSFFESPEQVERYFADPALRKRLHTHERGMVRMLTMNVAVSPFDDIHVRRAVNLVVDKRRHQEVAGGPVLNRIAGHVAPNFVQDDLLIGYDAFPTPGNAGDLTAARGEMSASRYDANRDGSCDHPACARVRTLVFNNPDMVRRMEATAEDLAKIGINLALEATDDAFDIPSDPKNRVPLVYVGWVGATAASYFNEIFGGPTVNVTSNNWSRVGSKPEDLRAWGYEVIDVPSLDAKIESCNRATVAEQASCWAEADQQLMTTIVPIVPLLYDLDVRAVSARVTKYAYDPAWAMPALDHIAVRR